MLALLAVLLPTSAQASSLTVPDDIATIQAAFDARVDTVRVRAGIRDETPTASNGVVLLGIAGEPEFERPTVSGLYYLADHPDNDQLVIRNMTFNGQVRVASTGGGAMAFQDCRFLGGVRDISSDPPASIMTFRRCRIHGDATLAAEGILALDSCVVDGQVFAAHSRVDLIVTDCAFRGDGTGTAIRSNDIRSATIKRNVISGYGSGIVTEVDRCEIEDNIIRDCSWTGIHILGGAGLMAGNRVERCGYYGVFLPGSYEPWIVTNNAIVGCVGTGLLVECDLGTKVIGNLLYGNGRDGIEIDGSPNGDVEIRNNTSAFNQRSGYLFQIQTPYPPPAFHHNVGYRNERYGIEYVNSDAPVASCNAWFENKQGDISGMAPSSGDLTVDPLLCDPVNNDFHPSALSPLVGSPGCGLIGALGVGCAAPGVRENAFRLAHVGPNPSTGPVTIEFEMPHAASIEVEVFDILGRRVASPARGSLPAGRHSVAWTPRSGQAGVYLVRYRFPGGEERRRLVRTP